ncbi:MAG TPA: sigma-70 family RNA polymerase sigma factor [Roseiflexaceae bacterium]|nr:sigma-70 family RNA polymerase sigma factor [Roseiflexaceae bacterium]
MVPGPHIDLSVYASEAELLAGLRAGEPDACTCFVKRFAPLVYAKVLRMLGDPDEAESVLQLTFIKACEKIGSFEARSGLGTWLYRIAINEALMQLRRDHGGKVAIELLDEAIEPSELPQNRHAWPSDPARTVLDDELRAHLDRVLAALPGGPRCARAWSRYNRELQAATRAGALILRSKHVHLVLKWRC